uniref:Reticulon n=2 Tax=Leptobrachium leishanense TaxID=445787 RepID=A0A8C5R2J6_9ANUR
MQVIKSKMAETTGHQSSHISSSVGEKGGSCAELQHTSPDSPGSPFEVIANGQGFEFKDLSGNKGATSHEFSAEEPRFDQLTDTTQSSDVGRIGSAGHGETFFHLDSLLHHKEASKNECDRQYFEIESFPAADSSLPSRETKEDCMNFKQHAERFCDNDIVPIPGEKLHNSEFTSESEMSEFPYEAKCEIHWPDVDEEVDSSGESDDTVIDAGWRSKNFPSEKREQHIADGWVELSDSQKAEKSGNLPDRIKSCKEGEDPSHVESHHAKMQSAGRLHGFPEESSKPPFQVPDLVHSEGFVDLAESCMSDPTGASAPALQAELLDDKVQETLTIEALRSLAAGEQDWDSESRESSPEMLCPLRLLSNTERLVQPADIKLTESLWGVNSDLSYLKVHDLLFWRDVKKSGLVFGLTMVLLLSLAAFSIISVLSYLILSLLTVTISYRVYKSVMQAVQKSDDGHPFKDLLDKDIALSSDSFQKKIHASLAHINQALKYLVRLFLVEDLVDSLKLALLMWLMTYVGAVFNGITLLILGVLVAFTAPLIYEKYKVQIDHYVSLVQGQVKSITEKIQAKLPGALKKKTE